MFFLNISENYHFNEKLLKSQRWSMYDDEKQETDLRRAGKTFAIFL